MVNLEKLSLGKLCAMLADANVNIYKYENLKWTSRKGGQVSSTEIDGWDKTSRQWNEQRSKIKNRIDEVLRDLANNPRNISPGPGVQDVLVSFQTLPISQMVDMLIIESIKMYDLGAKGDAKGVDSTMTRRDSIIKTIDDAINQILKSGRYDVRPESRTF